MGMDEEIARRRVADYGAKFRRIAKNKPVKSLLRDAYKPDLQNWREYFVPLDTLDAILHFDAVKRHLIERVPGCDADTIARRVCGICETDSVHITPDSYRKIFAILILLEKEGMVLDFVEENTNDECLPFPLSSTECQIPCLADLGDNDIKLFDDYQWYMLAPYFARLKDETVPQYIFHPRTIFPWTYYGEEIRSGYSRVRPVEIHPEHHNLGKSNAFAIKELESRPANDKRGKITQEDFNREVQASEKLQGDPNLVTLVATYQYKNGYYLLFPWANGGNLWDFWARQDPTSLKNEHNLLLWVAEQCVRLANGLAKIHDTNVADCSAAAFVDGQRDRGFHGDIKPENILCFKKDPDNDLGDLKISDFGLTNFHSDKSKSLIPPNRPHSPTYRAPEIDLSKPLSRKYDIWGLGCVFLEMIVWLILGQKGLKEFGDSRFDEQEQGLSQVKQDNFFKIETGQEKAIVKESVTKRIRELQGDQSCSDYLFDFLSYIEDHMLVVDQNTRPESSELCEKLTKMQESCKGNQSYTSGKTESEAESRAEKLASHIKSPPAEGVQGEGKPATTHSIGSSTSGPLTRESAERKRPSADQDSILMSKRPRRQR